MYHGPSPGGSSLAAQSWQCMQMALRLPRAQPRAPCMHRRRRCWTDSVPWPVSRAGTALMTLQPRCTCYVPWPVSRSRAGRGLRILQPRCTDHVAWPVSRAGRALRTVPPRCTDYVPWPVSRAGRALRILQPRCTDYVPRPVSRDPELTGPSFNRRDACHLTPGTPPTPCPLQYVQVTSSSRLHGRLPAQPWCISSSPPSCALSMYHGPSPGRQS
jgi:hypothetical protein